MKPLSKVPVIKVPADQAITVNLKETIDAAKSTANLAETAPVDIASPVRQGMFALVVMFGGFFTWAALAPLDEGVPLAAQVVVEGNRKAVQHLNGGIVSSIDVQDGDRVKAGDLLLTLDVSMQQGQQQIFQSQLAGLEAQNAGLMKQIPLRGQQVSSLSQEIAKLKPLVDEDLYPRNRYTEQLRQLSQLKSQLNSDRTNLQQNLAQISELKERTVVMAQDIDRAEIRSPADGVVLGMQVHTIGGVIRPGDRILEIIPDTNRFEIAASVPPFQIESVRNGLPVQLRFSALDHRKTPEINGTVSRVGADVITDERGNQFYTARIVVTPEEIARLGDAELHPGMPVEAIVITGERTFLNYFVKPLSDSFARSLKER